MADKSKIEWTDATWNPIRGCARVSEGCRNCYAEVMAARFSQPGQWGFGLARTVEVVTKPQATGKSTAALPRTKTDHRWTGKVEFVETALDLPLRWKRPRRIFVNSTSDLFHEAVTDEWIDRVFAVMALCPQHTFQILTKRPERAVAYFQGGPGEGWGEVNARVTSIAREMSSRATAEHWSALGAGRCHHILFGTSAENQEAYDERREPMLSVGSWLGGTFLSAEPLLGPLNLDFMRDHCDLCGGTGLLARWPKGRCHVCGGRGTLLINGPRHRLGYRRLSWVIVGGESGPGARPMHPDWVRSLRDQCAAAGVPFFFKQWGEWGTAKGLPGHLTVHHVFDDGYQMIRLGKKRAGRLLDGVEYNGFPEAR